MLLIAINTVHSLFIVIDFISLHSRLIIIIIITIIIIIVVIIIVIIIVVIVIVIAVVVFIVVVVIIVHFPVSHPCILPLPYLRYHR
jgi:hypothetical protein